VRGRERWRGCQCKGGGPECHGFGRGLTHGVRDLWSVPPSVRCGMVHGLPFRPTLGSGRGDWWRQGSAPQSGLIRGAEERFHFETNNGTGVDTGER